MHIRGLPSEGMLLAPFLEGELPLWLLIQVFVPPPLAETAIRSFKPRCGVGATIEEMQ